MLIVMLHQMTIANQF